MEKSAGRFDTSTLEKALNRPLTDEETGQLQLWEKGRALAQLTIQYGWDVALEMLQSYVVDAVKQMVDASPAEEEKVLGAHRVAYTANQIFLNFKRDVEIAVEASRKPPPVIMDQLGQPSPIPPEI